MPDRKSIGDALRSAWSAEDREAYRKAVPRAIEGGVFAKCLKEKMEAGTAGNKAYKECAEKAGIASELSKAWR